MKIRKECIKEWASVHPKQFSFWPDVWLILSHLDICVHHASLRHDLAILCSYAQVLSNTAVFCFTTAAPSSPLCLHCLDMSTSLLLMMMRVKPDRNHMSATWWQPSIPKHFWAADVETTSRRNAVIFCCQLYECTRFFKSSSEHKWQNSDAWTNALTHALLISLGHLILNENLKG